MMIVHVTDVSTWELYSLLVECFELVHDDCTCYRCWYMGMVHQMHNLHVTVVHCASINCTIACCGIGTIIPDCDCQHGILYYRIYHSRLGISVWIVSAELNSGCFFEVHGEFDWRIGRSLTVCLQLRYGSST